MAVGVPLNRAKDFYWLIQWVNSLHDRCKREEGRRRKVCKGKGETSFLLSSIPQRAKKIVSDSLGLVDFATGLVFFFLTCPTGKCCFLGKFKLQKDCYQSCQSKRVLGLVEMTCGLVHAIYSLPEWQAVKLTFFAPWSPLPFLSFPIPSQFPPYRLGIDWQNWQIDGQKSKGSYG